MPDQNLVTRQSNENELYMFSDGKVYKKLDFFELRMSVSDISHFIGDSKIS